MQDQIPLVSLIVSAGVQVWAWRRVVGRQRQAGLTRLQSVARYAAWAFLPLLLFIAGFFAMVALEEWLRVSLIGERWALLILPLLGLAGLGTTAFAVRCVLVRTAS